MWLLLARPAGRLVVNSARRPNSSSTAAAIWWGEIVLQRAIKPVSEWGWPLAGGIALAAAAVAVLLAPSPQSTTRLAAPARQTAVQPAVLSPADNPLTAPPVLEELSYAAARDSNAEVAVSTAPNPPAAPFHLVAASPADRQRAVNCLALVAYYEAGNQGPKGQAAVVQVVLNRVRHPLFPKTVCGVVFNQWDHPPSCQFSFTCDGSLNRPPSAQGWKQAIAIAERALNGYVEPSVGESTHFHADYVVPYWRSEVVKVVQIGACIFYRIPGPLGQPAAFVGQYNGAEIMPAFARRFDKIVIIPADDSPAAVADDAGAHATPVVARQVQPVQLALAPVSELAVDAPNPKRQGYFGRGGNDDQRLPSAASHW